MIQSQAEAVVLYRRQKVDWCEYHIDKATGQCLVLLRVHDPNGYTTDKDHEHIEVSETIEIYLHKRLLYHSPDMWHRGQIRPY